MDQSLHEILASSRTVDECEDETRRREVETSRNEDVRYVTLVVKDENVFMVHRDVLLKASPFFEKLLKSAKGNEEGMIRLEMFTAPLMEIILKFMYHGRTQINTEEDAKNLIIAAEQLLLLRLKDVAVRFLQQKLSISNCITTYYFAEERQCEELRETSRNFIYQNFVKLDQSKDFLDLSSREIEKWISSDDVVINDEADVFNIILRWIDHNKKERMEQFEELFRHVRLIFISRDCLSSFVAKSSLVKFNVDCLDRVTQAIKWLDKATDCEFPWQQSPRKSLQSHVIVAYRQNKVLCYVPIEDRWLNLPDVKSEPVDLVSRQGKLYAISRDLDKCQRYEPLYNDWVPLTRTEMSVKPNIATNPRKRDGVQVLIVQGEIYVVEDRPSTVLWKYNFNSISWNSFPAFDWGEKDQVCVVAAEEFVYAIGGRRWGGPNEGYVTKCYFLSDVDRFSTKENAWEKMADIQEPRRLAFGTAVQEKIFIAGGIGATGDVLQTCEVHNTLTNDWQFIASLAVPRMFGSMVYVAEMIFVLGGSSDPSYFPDESHTVECYDHKTNKWKKRASVPFENLTERSAFITLKACPAQVFKDVISSLPSSESSQTAKSNSSHVCVIT